MSAALELLERGEIAVDDLFTHEFELTEIDRAFSMFNDKRDDVCKVLVRP
jgi:alcohol dehydrogenase